MKFSLKATLLTGLLMTVGLAQAEVVVTTGAGYIPMVKALTKAYEAKTGETVAKAVGGNIGQMLAQVANGNGVNVVVSDDKALAKFAQHLDGKPQPLGVSPLVMVWRQGLTLSAPTDITKPEIKSIAYPDPKAAIYGRSAHKWLTNTGLLAQVKDKTNAASHVPQVMGYVTSGNMDVGFVNVVAYKKNADKLGGHFDIFDHGAAVNMQVQAVKGAGDAKDVQAFLAYLKSDEAKKIMANFGVK